MNSIDINKAIAMLQTSTPESVVTGVSVRIDSPDFRLWTNGSFFCLLNEVLDIDQSAKITMRSHDNFFRTTKTAFEKMPELLQNQLFRHEIFISLENYFSFNPYILHFARIKPITV